jgi:PAS domain S-box-containing protein
MGTAGITRSATLAALAATGGPAEPVTADELAAKLDCDRETAVAKLEELGERGDVETKRVGEGARVWWTNESDRRDRELERYEPVVETINDGIYVKGEDNRFTLVNRTDAEMVGYSPDELVGQDSSAFVSDEVMAAAEELYRKLREQSGETETIEATLEIPDGETVVTEGSFALIPPQDEDDEHERVGVVRDITERKERERRLERQNKRLESFASMLAHELRNPLTIGQIYSDQIPEESDSEAVEHVLDAFDRIEDMIDVLLVLARGREAVGESNPVAVAEVAEAAWTEVEAPDATLLLETDRVVRADETYVRHLFENLLENAVEHGRPDVTITVGDLSTGFYGADDGEGISEADRETVFEAGDTTAETQGGTGVGLTFV